VSVLQSIDVALFRFINGTLQNSFFDSTMPFFAGSEWFMPLLFILGAAVIWKGGVRGRLCMLMLTIVLPLGDGWITNSLKRSVQRPRPCRVLENVNLPMVIPNPPEDDENEFHRGCTDSGSMPSGHTTNWFAATMVAWMFYRRTARFMLPLACLVAFSRVYNGVHYPADVLMGAVIGAGYGAAIVLALEALWQFAAGRFFPLWWLALPSLVPAKNFDFRVPSSGPAKPETRNPKPETIPTADAHWLRLAYVLIAAVLIGKLAYIASGRIELSEDEAYQWLWSKHLALSYASKPPLIAYTQWVGTHLFGDNQFGVRFFSPVCAAIGSFVGLRFFAKHVSARAGFWLVAIINVTPLLAIGSTLLTIDALLVLFWTLAMFAGWRAAQPNGRTSDWALVGLWMGLAFLSKYTALFQWLCWAVFFVLWQPARIHLRRPGPYIALAINFFCALPVLVWNAQHGWITAAHVANDAKAGAGWKFDWRAAAEFLGGSAGVLHPIFFAATLWAAIAIWKRHTRDPLMRFFFAMGAPLFLVYALYTLHSSVQINWIAASVVPLLCLMVSFWDRRFNEGTPHIRAWLTIAVLTGALATMVLHETHLVKKLTGSYLPPEMDPLRRVRGGTELARIVATHRNALADEGPPVFVIGGHYGTTSLLTFYMEEARTNVNRQPLVHYRSLRKSKTQFYFWPGYADGTRQGQNAIYVQERRRRAPPPRDVVKDFATVTEIGRFPIVHRNRVLHHVQVFACRNLKH
jgi:4-amino-4-deoxy-L-arabinose transferase-like glycosyltransferase/membrane-associated phospholipid phosphatase